MLAMKYYDAAGRTAYLAGIHAAQALISEKTGRAVKTHKGVNVELQRLTKDDPGLDRLGVPVAAGWLGLPPTRFREALRPTDGGADTDVEDRAGAPARSARVYRADRRLSQIKRIGAKDRVRA